MKLRIYESSDCEEMTKLFYDTVHTVNAADYRQEQLDVWATGQVDLDAWDASFREHYTVVAEFGDRIIGFGDIDSTGYLDRLYVHKDHQREGVGRAICDVLENAFDVDLITTHASITAKSFFESCGYRVVKAQQVLRGGIALTNFVMEKELKK